MIEFILNEERIQSDFRTNTPMVDFLRYHKKLKGTKIGCREGDCGACTILVGKRTPSGMKYESMTSCIMPLANAHGKHIVSIEGINLAELNPVQQAMVDNSGTQCGFCTVGFVVSFAGFCLSEKSPSYENAIASIDGNICRCTGYKSIEKAAGEIAEKVCKRNETDITKWLVDNNYIPNYFLDIESRLNSIAEFENTPSSNVVAGGTDLFVQKPEKMLDTASTFVAQDKSLRYIKSSKNIVTIGGASTVEDLRDSDLIKTVFPRMKAFMKLISSTPIRNMATVAGNIVNASPIGDLTIFFLALDARLNLKTNDSARVINLKDFYLGYKTLAKENDELIESLFFEIPKEPYHFNFEKVSKRTHLDIASVNSSILITYYGNQITKAHVSAGGTGPTPLYLTKTSNFLAGKEMNKTTFIEANKIAQTELSPISDARGSEHYKRLLFRQLFAAHFMSFPQSSLRMEDLK